MEVGHGVLKWIEPLIICSWMYFDDAAAAPLLGVQNSSTGVDSSPWLPRAGTGEMLDCSYQRLKDIKGFKCCSAWRVPCKRGENNSHLFPSATKSLSTAAEKKTLGKYSKCGKRGISAICVCSRLFAKSRQTWMLLFQFSVKSFVLFSACCSSPCRSSPSVGEVLFILPSLPGQQGLASLSLLYLQIIQLCLPPPVVVSSGLFSSFPAGGRSMLGLVRNSPRCFSGHLFKNWSLAFCERRKNNQVKCLLIFFL